MVNQKGTDSSARIAAVIPAAGSGIRMGLTRPKQFLDLSGKPLLAVTLAHFQECDFIDKIVVVVSQEDIGYCLREIVDKYKLNKVAKVVAGGKSRQQSVRKGIEVVGGGCEWVLVHDGVRPFVTTGLIGRVVTAAKSYRAVITGLPVKDTVKEVDDRGTVIGSVDRQRVWLVQTPQIFRWEDINRAHQTAVSRRWEEGTDDAFLIERMGVPVKIIEGEEKNMKVTTPQDLEIAQFLISKEQCP